nr:glycosyltransferase [Tamilnaduibacter salinus]
MVYAGTFGRVNGISYLVEMAKYLLDLNPDVRFLAVGDGIESAEVVEKARNAGVLGQNFFMEPPVSKSSMPALLNAATVTTSLVIDNKALWDNSANKFFDSLAAGRPIFVNHGGWQADLLEETGAGFEVPGNDPRKAAKLVCEFVGNPDEVRKAGHAARELALTRFDRNILAQQLDNVLGLALRDDHV